MGGCCTEAEMKKKDSVLVLSSNLKMFTFTHNTQDIYCIYLKIKVHLFQLYYVELTSMLGKLYNEEQIKLITDFKILSVNFF